MPPEKVFTSAVGGVGEVELLEQLVGRGARPRPCDMPCSRPTISRLSRALISPSTVACCAATPMRLAHRGGAGGRRRSRRRWPLPSVGPASVVRMRIAVVLPAPLWPSRPSTVPGATSRSRSRSAHRSPKRLPRPLAAMPPAPRASWRGLRYRGVVVWCTALSYIVRRTLAVHCTTWQARYPARSRRDVTRGRRSSAVAPVRELDEAPTEKINAEARPSRPTKVGAEGRRKHVETLERLAAHLETLDLWTRAEPGARKPRFTRDDIAAAAIRIADAEGFDALSMRRLAAELDAGTMTLYHYVRTKDELLDADRRRGAGRGRRPRRRALPRDWRAADHARSPGARRDALRRHPWILDIADDPSIGPNACATSTSRCRRCRSLHGRASTTSSTSSASSTSTCSASACTSATTPRDDASDTEMIDYIGDLLVEGDYPALAEMVAELGLEPLWSQIHAHARGAGRFDRNLARLLAGFEASLGDRPSAE